MDNNLLTALIAAGSACLGAFIPSLFSYLGKKKEFKNDKAAKIETIRREEYGKYIEALQIMVNNSNKDNFLLLQESTNKLLLFAGPELCTTINEYYNKLVESANQKRPMSLEEQTKYQTDIFNAMRKELGISTKELKKTSMIRA